MDNRKSPALTGLFRQSEESPPGLSFFGAAGTRTYLISFRESVIANGRIDFHEIILNVVAFVPFGVFAYALWQEKSLLSQILPVFLTSLGFEVIQFIFAIGATDITDLITNTSGGVIGIGIAFVLSKIFKNNWKKCINIIGFVCAVLLNLFILVLLRANL